MSHERFKMLRRNSLQVECPEGIWDDFEELEDRDEVDDYVTHKECMNLQQMLSDRTKLPQACMGSNGMVNTSAGETATITPAARMPEIVRRLTGAVPGAFTTDPAPARPNELGGRISMNECHTLKSFLMPSAGGSYLLPSACGSMLKKQEDEERAIADRENAEVYRRLKRRMTQVQKEDFPPTFT